MEDLIYNLIDTADILEGFDSFNQVFETEGFTNISEIDPEYDFSGNSDEIPFYLFFTLEKFDKKYSISINGTCYENGLVYHKGFTTYSIDSREVY